MEKRIVVITSDYLYTFVSEAYKEINLDCEVEIVKYDNFKNIANIYNHYKDSASVVLLRNGLKEVLCLI